MRNLSHIVHTLLVGANPALVGANPATPVAGPGPRLACLRGPEAAASSEMNMEFIHTKPGLKMLACEEVVPKKRRPTLL
jgi:hypothetical protein